MVVVWRRRGDRELDIGGVLIIRDLKEMERTPTFPVLDKALLPKEATTSLHSTALSVSDFRTFTHLLHLHQNIQISLIGIACDCGHVFAAFGVTHGASSATPAESSPQRQFSECRGRNKGQCLSRFG